MQYENISEKEQFSADEGATERALPFQRIKMEKNRFRYFLSDTILNTIAFLILNWNVI
jgi:hypothetical protein